MSTRRSKAEMWKSAITCSGQFPLTRNPAHTADGNTHPTDRPHAAAQGGGRPAGSAARRRSAPTTLPRGPSWGRHPPTRPGATLHVNNPGPQAPLAGCTCPKSNTAGEVELPPSEPRRPGPAVSVEGLTSWSQRLAAFHFQPKSRSILGVGVGWQGRETRILQKHSPLCA